MAKNSTVVVRVSDFEKFILEKLALESGMSVSEYVRDFTLAQCGNRIYKYLDEFQKVNY